MITLYEAVLHTASNVGTDTQITGLLDKISFIRDTTSALNTNENCWRSEHKYNDIDWLLKEITTNVFHAIEYYSTKDTVFSQALHKYNKKNLQIFYWTNINQPLSRNVMHSHKSAVFSGVYYVQGSDTGALRIVNPANMLGECNSLSPFTRDFYYTPRDRDLILWPSWLPHEVEVNTSSKERINIAYDIVL